jgi:hypothetical protein
MFLTFPFIEQAIALKTPSWGSVSVTGMFRQSRVALRCGSWRSLHIEM